MYGMNRINKKTYIVSLINLQQSLIKLYTIKLGMKKKYYM